MRVRGRTHRPHTLAERTGRRRWPNYRVSQVVSAATVSIEML